MQGACSVPESTHPCSLLPDRHLGWQIPRNLETCGHLAHRRSSPVFHEVLLPLVRRPCCRRVRNVAGSASRRLRMRCDLVIARENGDETRVPLPPLDTIVSPPGTRGRATGNDPRHSHSGIVKVSGGVADKGRVSWIARRVCYSI